MVQRVGGTEDLLLWQLPIFGSSPATLQRYSPALRRCACCTGLSGMGSRIAVGLCKLRRERSVMKPTRRDLIKAGCTVAAASLVPHEVDAWAPHGVAVVSGGHPQTAVNAGNVVGMVSINHAKGLTLGSSSTVNYPQILNSDGFPIGPTLTHAIGGGDSSCFNPNYYGHFLVYWNGTGGLQLQLGTIVYSGGQAVYNISPATSGQALSSMIVTNFNSGAVAGNPTQTAGGTNAQGGPNTGPVEFCFGGLVSSAQNNGGLIQFTAAGSGGFSGIGTGSWVKPNNLTYNGGAFPTGPNFDGSWVITQNDNNHISMQGSGSLNPSLISVVASGGPGTQTEIIQQPPPGFSWGLPTGSHYVGFANLTIVQQNHFPAQVAGQLVNPDYVTLFKTLNPRWLRWMDMMAVQGDRSTSYTNRTKVTSFNWGPVNTITGCYTPSSSILNNGSDAFACNSPANSPSSGAYVEGEIVIGYISGGANTTHNPTLNVNSRGAKPILDRGGAMLTTAVSGTVPPNLAIISITFTGSPLSSYTYQYQLNANSSNVFTGSCSGTTLTITGVTSGNVTIGQIVQGSTLNNQVISQLTGTPNGIGTYQVAISQSQALGSTITGLSPYLFQGGGSTPDTTWGSIAANIRADIDIVAANLGNGTAINLVNANISCQNPWWGGTGFGWNYNPNINSSGVAALHNGMTITASDSSSAGTYTTGYMNIGYIPNGTYVAFTYSIMLDGWISSVGNTNNYAGVNGGCALELIADTCQRVGCGAWINIGLLWSDSRIYNTVYALATYNGTGVKQLLLELSNETFLAFNAEYGMCLSLGAGMGFNVIANNSINSDASEQFYALKTIQIANQAIAAWAAAGRNRSDLVIHIGTGMGYTDGTTDTSTVHFKFNSPGLDCRPSVGTANPTLKAYGGYAATALTSNWAAVGSRAIDQADSFGDAPYWGGALYNSGNGSSALAGFSLATYNPALLAAYNYVNGNSTQQQAALDFLYNATAGHGDLYDGQISGSYPFSRQQLGALALGSGDPAAGYIGIGQTAAMYDSVRISDGRPILQINCYEGGWYIGPVSQGDVNAQATQLSGMGDVNGYTSSLSGAATGGPTSTAATDAQNLFTLLTAFKQDSRCVGLVTRYLTECKAAGQWNGLSYVTSRIVSPAWFGLEGIGVNVTCYWSMLTGYVSSTPTGAVTAISTFDAE